MKDTIGRYYLEELVSLNNKHSPKSFELREKVKILREKFKKLFKWEGEIAFFPNPYYAKRTLFNNCGEYRCFSNEKDEALFEGLGYCEYIESPSLLPEKSKNCLFWEGKLDENNLDFSKTRLVLSGFSDLDTKYLNQAYAFVYTPIKGVTVLGYRSEEFLFPLYFGSSSVGHVSRSEYFISKNEDYLECGTGNYPLLLFLEKRIK